MVIIGILQILLDAALHIAFGNFAHKISHLPEYDYMQLRRTSFREGDRFENTSLIPCKSLGVCLQGVQTPKL